MNHEFCAFVRVLHPLPPIHPLLLSLPLPQTLAPVALIIHLLLVHTTTTIGEVMAIISVVGVTIVVMVEVVVVVRIVVVVAIKGNNTILLGTRAHLHQVYLLLIVLVLP